MKPDPHPNPKPAPNPKSSSKPFSTPHSPNPHLSISPPSSFFSNIPLLTPSSFIFWNCNALRPRLEYSVPEIANMLATHDPDIVFLSEVRLTCASLHTQSSLSTIDQKSQAEKRLYASSFTTGPFSAYSQVALSLTTKRYAGTACFIKKSLLMTGSVNVSYCLPGTAPTTSSKPAANTPSIASFFGGATKKQKLDPHDPDGRLIMIECETIYIVHVYAPNNGKDQTSFDRRTAWDDKVRGFFKAVQRNGGVWEGKPVLFCGDLNVTPKPLEDLSHPSWFKMQFKSDVPGYSGQPGMTPNEVAAFDKLCCEGNLVDAYRHLHPHSGDACEDITRPLFTWRGTRGADTPEAGRYFRKAMRIDLLLVNKAHVEMIGECEITGEGECNKDPSFCGSDHCPVYCRLE